MQVHIDSVPKVIIPEEVVPVKETKNSHSGGLLTPLFILLLLSAIGFLGWQYVQLNEQFKVKEVKNSKALEKISKENKSLESNIASLEQDKAELETKLTTMEQANNKSESDLKARYAETINQKNADKKKFEREINIYKDKLSEEQQKQITLVAQVNEFKTAINAILDDNKEFIKSPISNSESSIYEGTENLKNLISVLKDQNQKLRSENNELNRKLDNKFNSQPVNPNSHPNNNFRADDIQSNAN